ncbi:MAG: hypothetical protein IJ191_09665 [Treponema sp.]|nr:hypothetical protein [Treponema sp.]
MKKVFFLLCLFVLPLTAIRALDGDLSGTHGLRIITTKWFDIIFPPDSHTSARLLAANADRIYEELYAVFGMEPFDRLPVTITPAVEQINAYFTSAPYNRIVMYDAAVTEDLAVFSEKFLSIFRHECAHAVTFNLKNTGWRRASAVFGDVMSWANLTLSHGRAEGIAVFLESMAGEGRINDEYARHMVLQAKIEGEFPAYADVQGASELYPTGSYYLFNALFFDWLDTQYGREALVNFILHLNNYYTHTKHITVNGAFAAVYGISLKTAWEAFRDSLHVPAVPPSPLLDTAYADGFSFVRGMPTNGYSSANGQGAYYSSLSNSAAGIACIDAAHSRVLFFAKNADGSYQRPKTLFRRTAVQSINLSADGRFLAMIVLSTRAGAPKKEAYLYDRYTRRFFKMPDTGMQSVAVLAYDGAYSVAAVRYAAGSATAVFYDLVLHDGTGRIASVREVYSEAISSDATVFRLVDCGSGRLAALVQRARRWYIVLRSALGGETCRIALPADMGVRGLSYAGTRNGADDYFFSCTVPGSMPRLARLSVNDGAARLVILADDVSGGIYDPVALDEQHVMYSGSFYRSRRLLVANTDRLRFETVPLADTVSVPQGAAFNFVSDGGMQQPDSVITAGVSASDTAAVHEPPLASGTASAARAYNPFSAFKYGGVFVPLSIARTVGLDEDGMLFNPALIGITYVMSNPWMSPLFIISAGFHPLPLSGVLWGELFGGTATQLFQYGAVMSVAFDAGGYQQLYSSARATVTVPVGRYASFAVGDEALLFHGRFDGVNEAWQHLIAGIWYSSISPQKVFRGNTTIAQSLLVRNTMTARFSTVHRRGVGSFAYGGVTFSLWYDTLYEQLPAYGVQSALFHNAGGSIAFRVPRILPISGHIRHTYNLPLSGSVSFFPSLTQAVSVNTSLVLYAYEIQKAIPRMGAFFVNSIAVFAFYGGTVPTATASWNIARSPEIFKRLFSTANSYHDRVGLRVALDMTPNIGTFSTALFKATLSFSVYYNIRGTAAQPVAYDISFQFANISL